MSDYDQLLKENQYLKKILATLLQRQDMGDLSNVLTKKSPLDERVKLYKHLFQGRTDVYALRWESSDGKKGYKPARKQVPQKSPDKNLLPLSDQTIKEHMSGEKTIGVYPLLQNDSCRFLAIDFDKRHWKMDVTLFSEICRKYQIPHHVERSRSGDGAHVWIFFAEAVLAQAARKMGMFLLNETKKMNASFSLDSFDRLFPNQDVLPEGGFGNLIALPLQRQPGLQGNSLFVDENFIPHPDQWLYLSTIRKMTKLEVDNILYTLQDKGPVAEQMPDELNIILKNGLYIEKYKLPPSLMEKMNALASFSNPNYYKAKQNRFPVHNIPRVIWSVEETRDSLVLPRGCLSELLQLCSDLSIKTHIIDEKYEGNSIQTTFRGNLTPGQEEALETLRKYEHGILTAATGFGKTVLAAALIASRQTNTLVVVHRSLLVQQWRETLATFLEVPIDSIGQIGGGKHKPTGFIDVATIQSLNYKGELKSIITQYGQIIVDECHVIPAVTFESVLKQIRPKFILGLTATPKRKDGMHPIITMQCGPIRYQTNAKAQAQVRPFVHRLISRKTAFTTDKTDFQEICEDLAMNNARNQQIFDDVLHALEAGRSPIVLTNRVFHLEILTKMFQGFAKNVIVLSGNKKKKELNHELKKLSEISDGEERLIIATGKYIGEGFDDARLDTLFLTMPVSWKGTLNQYVGRLHRIHDNKQEIQVYDYLDDQVPLLQNMYKKRLKGYKAMGYSSNEKGSNSEQMRLF